MNRISSMQPYEYANNIKVIPQYKTYYYNDSLVIICSTLPHHCQGASALLLQLDTEDGLKGQDLIRQS
jgi:hypothetical protein